MFSRRTPASSSTNRLTRALAARTRPYHDLTASNPTAVGLGLSPPLHLLSDPRGARYEPDPRGLRSAREAVSAWYAERGVPVSPDRIVLSASSSEAYGWLLKLLAEPGDAVLVPAPSYPLLDALAGLESVELHRYPLDPADGWRVHASAVEEALLRVERLGRRVAAVVLVAPNNPTGTSLRRAELDRLLELAGRHGFAVISDEVFLDYRWGDGPDDVRVAAAGSSDALVFSLGGLSKAAALPQLKLGWLVANGPPALLAEALHRLEWIADTYLSVGTPVQRALPELLSWSTAAVTAVRARIEANHALLAAALPAGGALSLLPHRGGWSAVLRVPAVVPEEELVLELLESTDTLVHPGYFFDFPFEAFLVVSLLAAPGTFTGGLAGLASVVHNPPDMKKTTMAAVLILAAGVTGAASARPPKTPPPSGLQLTLVSPTAGTELRAGETITVVWEVTGLAKGVDLKWCEQEVYVSIDGRQSRLTPELGAAVRKFTWTVPERATDDAFFVLRFGCQLNGPPESRFPQTDSVFRILPSTAPAARVDVSAPALAEVNGQEGLSVSWKATGDFASYEVLASYDRGLSFQSLGTTEESTLTFKAPAGTHPLVHIVGIRVDGTRHHSNMVRADVAAAD